MRVIELEEEKRKDGKVNLEKYAICFIAGVILIASCGSEIELTPEEQRIKALEERVDQLISDLHQSNEEKEDLTTQLINAINDRGSGITMSLGIGLGMVIFTLVIFNLIQFKKGQDMHQQVRQLIESRCDQIEMSNYLDYHKGLEKQVAKIKNSVQIDKKSDGDEKGFDQC